VQKFVVLNIWDHCVQGHGRRKDFVQGEAPGNFSKIFPGGPKVVKFVFSHLKVRKQPFFAENFKIWGWARFPHAPLSTSMCKDNE